MLEWIGPVVVASFLGSAHCAGMCGGVVTLATAQQRGSNVLAHVAYQTSRLAGYATLGAIAGGAGASLNVLLELYGFKHVAAFATGGLMLAWGIVGLWPTLSARFAGRGDSRPNWVSRQVARGVAQAQRWPRLVRAAALGALTALLPCGWLYAFGIAAAGTGSALSGAGVLAAFWLGSAPVLVGLGGVGRTLYQRLGPRAPVFSSLLIIALGLSNLWSHYNLPAAALSHIANPLAPATSEAMPACHAHLN